jgi:hypothetical protein
MYGGVGATALATTMLLSPTSHLESSTASDAAPTQPKHINIGMSLYSIYGLYLIYFLLDHLKSNWFEENYERIDEAGMKWLSGGSNSDHVVHSTLYSLYDSD